MATTIEYGLITAGISVIIIAIVNHTLPQKHKIIPSDYKIELTDRGSHKQLGPVKKTAAGLGTVVYDDMGNERVAFVACDAPSIAGGELHIYEYMGEGGVFNIAACP